MTEENEKLPPLPQGWIWTKLEELADVVDVDHKMPKSVRDGVHFISPKDFVDPEGIDFENSKRISEEDFQRLSRKCKPESGDLIYSRIGTIGKVRKVPRDTLFHVSYSLCLIKPADTLKESDILYVFLKSPSVLKQALVKKRSIGVPDLGLGDIKKFMVPLAPLNEQKRIVGMVRELFSRLDAGVEGLRKVKAQLKRYRQAIFRYAFEGKLTEEWRKTHKHVAEPATKLLERIKQERREDPKRKELPPINISDLTELPENWTWTRLGEIGIVASGGTPSTKIPEYFDADVPWITPADLSDFTDKFVHRGRRNISEKGLNSSSAALLPEGTILFSSRAPIGYVAIAANPVSTNQGFKNLTLNKGIFNEYVFYYLKASKILAESYGSGTTFREVSAARFSLIPIPLAPFNEQHRIVEEIEQRLSLVDETQKTIAQAISQSDRLRQSILKIAFESRLVSQDPSDEPAEKLLERIKEERAKSMGEKDTSRRKKNKPKQLELSTYVK